MSSSVLLEVCVDSIASALAAQAGGAACIELCASLLEGGLTPSAATIEIARQQLTIGINVMIRPRGGDFLYSDLEVAIMARDIEIAKSAGAQGIVLGLLTADGEIDTVRLEPLIAKTRPLSVTFHRAFDMVADAHRALDTLIDLGVDRVLTSGLAPTALVGATTIASLIKRATGRIIIMPGGGITPKNIAAIAQQTNAQELHMSGRATYPSPMRHQNPHVRLSGTPDAPDYSQQITSAENILASLMALNHHQDQI